MTVTSLVAPGASVKRLSLTATPPSVPRRFGLTTPLADCVHGRALTVTVSACLDALRSWLVDRTGLRRRSTCARAARAVTGRDRQPAVRPAPPVPLGSSARAITAPPAAAASTPAAATVFRPVDTISCTPRPSLLASSSDLPRENPNATRSERSAHVALSARDPTRDPLVADGHGRRAGARGAGDPRRRPLPGEPAQARGAVPGADQQLDLHPARPRRPAAGQRPRGARGARSGRRRWPPPRSSRTSARAARRS